MSRPVVPLEEGGEKIANPADAKVGPLPCKRWDGSGVACVEDPISAIDVPEVAPIVDPPSVPYARPTYRLAKRGFDILVSAAGIVVLLPLFIAVGSLVALNGGQPLFRQVRVGIHGRRFHIYKFRTMVKDAEAILQSRPELMAEYHRYYKIHDDPRVSPLGRFLRATTLDELPQLFNVLRGDMSLVGPRPIVEPELEKYGDSKFLYLAMKPGCAGLWQCSGRSDTSYENRVKLDEEYYRRASLFFDASVLVRTLVAIFLRRGAH